MFDDDENQATILVGRKPAMSYVLATVNQFRNGKTRVRLKARGNAISRAVDVAEILRNRFLTNTELQNIEISTETLTTDAGDDIKVSSIEIFLFNDNVEPEEEE